MEYLQRDEWATVLTPAQVSRGPLYSGAFRSCAKIDVQVQPVLDLASKMYTVTLSADELRQEFPHLSESEVSSIVLM